MSARAIPPDTDLYRYIETYRIERGVTRSTAEQHRWTLNQISAFLGRPATLADLTPETVNRWLAGLIDGCNSIETSRSKRRNLLTLWTAAYDSGLTESQPLRIRKMPSRARLPEAWSLEELCALLAKANSLQGTFKRVKVPRASFFKAFILTAYCSGLRLSDLLDLRRDKLDADGNVSLVMRKTGRVITCTVSPEAIRAIDEISLPARVRIFGDVLSRGRVQKHFRALAKSAGLPGSIQRLRRTGATQVESIAPGSAMRFLGHRTPGLAYQSYVDPRYVQQMRPSPPPLTVPDDATIRKHRGERRDRKSIDRIAEAIVAALTSV